MQKEFKKRVETLTVIKIAETASATKRVEAHVTETVEPSVHRTENVTTKTYYAAKDIQERGRQMDVRMRRVSDTVETQGDVLLNIRAMLRDLLSNNECQSALIRIGIKRLSY